MKDYKISLARPEQLEALAAIERAAARLFADHLLPTQVRDAVVEHEQLAQACEQGRLWVAATAEGGLVGFALATSEGSDAFLQEMDVHPEHQQRGIGRALLQAVLDWAAARHFKRLTLTTFASPPWNAPFYQRCGFRLLLAHELCASLATKLEQEKARGLRERVAMEFQLPGTVTDAGR